MVARIVCSILTTLSTLLCLYSGLYVRILYPVHHARWVWWWECNIRNGKCFLLDSSSVTRCSQRLPNQMNKAWFPTPFPRRYPWLLERPYDNHRLLFSMVPTLHCFGQHRLDDFLASWVEALQEVKHAVCEALLRHPCNLNLLCSSCSPAWGCPLSSADRGHRPYKTDNRRYKGHPGGVFMISFLRCIQLATVRAMIAYMAAIGLCST